MGAVAARTCCGIDAIAVLYILDIILRLLQHRTVMSMPDSITMHHPQFLPEEANIWMITLLVLGVLFIGFIIISAFLIWRSANSKKNDLERKGLCTDEIPQDSEI